MKSALFTVSSDAYQITNIMYASAVHEIPQERRKGDSTHSFRIITPVNSAYCYFKNQDSARNARGALGALMEEAKTHLFKTGGECIDIAKVISFSRVVALKNTTDGMTHGFAVSLESAQERVWFTYKSEDFAIKARKALYASIQQANDVVREDPSARIAEPVKANVKGDKELPF